MAKKLEATPTVHSAIKAQALAWIECAPVQWDGITTECLKRGTATVQEIANCLDSMAERCARLSGYLEARGATGCGDNGHAEGVKSSNKKVTKVRKAIGYSYPKSDLSF